MRLARHLYDRVVRDCVDRAPDEACGVLSGPVALVDPTELHIMANVADDPRYRFAFDPQAQLDLWRMLDKRIHRPRVVYHCHVTTGPYPSEHDIRFAVDASLLHLVVSLQMGTPAARLFSIRRGTVVQEPLLVADGP